ncbi:hypothetical protein MRX96_059218 [Rhipicephalus microplus]
MDPTPLAFLLCIQSNVTSRARDLRTRREARALARVHAQPARTSCFPPQRRQATRRACVSFPSHQRAMKSELDSPSRRSRKKSKSGGKKGSIEGREGGEEVPPTAAVVETVRSLPLLLSRKKKKRKGWHWRGARGGKAAAKTSGRPAPIAKKGGASELPTPQEPRAPPSSGAVVGLHRRAAQLGFDDARYRRWYGARLFPLPPRFEAQLKRHPVNRARVRH